MKRSTSTFGAYSLAPVSLLSDDASRPHRLASSYLWAM
jgi:hypothetical protein